MNMLAAGALPLDDEQSGKLQSVVEGLTPAQLQWISGYTAGLAAAAGGISTVQPDADAAPDRALTVLYGSQTGNGKRIAEALGTLAGQRGHAVQVTSLADFRPGAIKRESLLALVVSTHGEGDPPDDAELFHEYLMSDKVPRLDELRYAVLALGDSSYTNFCQTGREIDARFSELGAVRIAELAECDLDYEDAAAGWSGKLVDSLPQLAGSQKPLPHLRAVGRAAEFGKVNPFAARVLVNQKITGHASTKDVRHIELSLEGSGLVYEPGDSLGVIVENPPMLVDELVEMLQLAADENVVLQGKEMRLRYALANELEITRLNLGFLRSWADNCDDDELRAALVDDTLRARLMDSHQIIDVIRRYPAEVTAQQFVESLRRLGARSYSISSSPTANPDEVHLTVAAVRYEAFGSPHWGAASTYLADRVAEGDTVSVFIESNKRFRLPEPERAIIMIGPGTGVAPFRAFVEERIEQGASAESWLFFGDRNFDSDFLYQLEWQRYLKQGRLTRMDVAFSRDQQHKIYVQDRIAANAVELYRWIENGAAIYVCGDAQRMAGDVHEALVTVIEKQAGIGRDLAERRLRDLRGARRYQRDVY